MSKKSGKLKDEEAAQLKKLLADYKKAGESIRNEATRERANPQQRVIQQFTEDYTAKVGVRYIVELDDDHIRLLRKVNKVFTMFRVSVNSIYTSPHCVMLISYGNYMWEFLVVKAKRNQLYCLFFRLRKAEFCSQFP